MLYAQAVLLKVQAVLLKNCTFWMKRIIFNQENIMKTQHLYFAAFAILFASCAKQEAEMSPVQSDNELRTFVADFEQTKTNLEPDGRKMIWSAGDKVGIFDASGVPQPFETKTGGASATFTGSATAPSGSWYAFYPYSAKAKMEEKDGKHYLLSAIPEIQYAKKDGVSDNVTLLVANCAANETTLSFKHACGLVKIELPVECISVTLEVLNPNDLWAQPLSGGVKVDFGKPTDSWSELLCYTSVTLVGENGGNIPAGTYYLAVKPIDFKGDVLLSIRNAKNQIYVKKRTGFTVGAGQIRPITINPGWVEDDGLNLFSEMGGNSIYTYVSGDSWNATQPLHTTDENQPKIYGKKGTKIEYSSDKAWSGRVGLYEGNHDFTKFIDKGYSVEYFVKFDESMLKNDRQFVFRNLFKIGVAPWDTDYDACNIIRYNYGDYPSTLGIQDTEWHRISFPLTSKLMRNQTSVSQFIIDPNFTDNAQATAAKGSIFYFDEVRLVRKTPTETPTE